MDMLSINATNASMTRAMSQYNSEQSKLENFQAALEKAKSSDDVVADADLKKACIDFESYFLQMMMKEMRKTVNTEGSFIPKSNAEMMFTEMMDEEVSKQNALAGGIGIASMMYKQMSREAMRENRV